MSLGVLRGVVLVVCVAGIVGMIVGTVATDNNNGVVVTFGLVAAVAMITLIVATMVTKHTTRSTAPVDEAVAERVEARIQSLVAAGADEATVRALVGEAVRLGRSLR